MNSVVIKFSIRGSLRFLSHAEMLRLFQRALKRAALPVRYSQGFNPHPRLSLPLPRPVGVECDDDLLCLRFDCAPGRANAAYLAEIKSRLARQLPQGCRLLEITLFEKAASLQPACAAYQFRVRHRYLDENLKASIRHLLQSKTLNLQRWVGPKTPKSKTVDVRGFLKSVDFDNNRITVSCAVSSAGTIRVDEILKLFELDPDKLAAPVRRTKIKWRQN